MKSQTKCMAAIVFASVATLLSCSTAKPPSFDGERAFAHLERQVAFGPRVPGTAAWSECRQWMCSYLDSLGLEVDSQTFSFYDPYSKTNKPLVNIIARVRPNGDEPAVLLGAHWDSRPRTDYHSESSRREEPIDGANDGASGVAVLLELAALLADQPPPRNIDLVLFDGEDWGKAGDLHLYLLGSDHFAKQGIRDTYRFGIVLDMIGAKNQSILRESYSEKYHPELNDMIWLIAAQLGITSFVDSVGTRVHDDHLSLNVGGVPSVVLIDFPYDYWHTEHDTPDKCSPQSLENVGRVMTEIVYNPSLWPSK